MKVTIENRTNTFYNEDRLKKQLDKMIDIILYSKNRKQLEDILNDFNFRDELFYLEWGFGASHFWVKQKGFEPRILFVKL